MAIDPALQYLIPVWLRDTPLGQIYIDEWAVTDDFDAALEKVRADPLYEQYFPGNKRDDGSTRYEEDLYLSTIESYADSIEAIGLNSDLPMFKDLFVKLIEGDVDGSEFWLERVEPINRRVLQRSQAVQQEYALMFGIPMTHEAILASVLDPEGLGKAILEEKIGMAELRGAYRGRFDATPDVMGGEYWNALQDKGLDFDDAWDLFANAEMMIPTISVLAARHADPDDDFDLNEFTSASIFADPFQASRMRRLMTQERASFQSASSQLDVVRNRLTGASGLQER